MIKYIILLFFALGCEAQTITAVTSAGKVATSSAPVNSVAPLLSGTVNLGDVLTTSSGTWSPTPDSYQYKWYRNGVAIGGQTASTYTLTYLDESATITSGVKAVKSGIISGESTSSNTKSVISIAAITNLEGWYDANNVNNVVVSSTMHNLKDKSTHTRDISSTGTAYPAYTASGGYNNTGYVSMANKELYTSASFTIAQPITVYFVFRQNTFTTGNQLYVIAGSNGFVSQTTQSSGSTFVYNGGSQYNHTTNGAIYNGSLNTNWQFMVNHWDNTHSYLQIKNEPYKQDGYPSQGQSGSSSANTFGFYPGVRQSDIDFTEMIIISGTLSSTDDANVRSYLTGKYAVVENKLSIWFGDSITTGALASDLSALCYVTLGAQAKGYDYVNISYPGSVAAATAFHPGAPGQNLEDVYTQVFNVNLSNAYIFFAYGTNDQSPDATWKATYKGIIQAFISRGVPLSHLTIIGVPYHSSTPAATPYMVAIASELGINYMDTQTLMANNGGATLMNVDGLHPTTAGHAIIGGTGGVQIYLP